MTLGIDIHPYYQAVVDWQAVASTPVQYVWVKVSDGGSRYVKTVNGLTYRPDTHVRGALSVGLPIGGYHYAQLSPSPEDQADVLTSEVNRLAANGVPPALDLEDPFRPDVRARDFAIRFLRKLKSNGFDRVAIYGNTSMFAAIQPDTWDIPGLIIWAADYGANNGSRNPDLRPYPGRADIHQYTSRGSVIGISGFVDLNESLTDFLESEMIPENEWRDFYTESGRPFREIQKGFGTILVDLHLYTSQLLERVSAIEARLDQVAAGNVDYAALAKAVNDDYARRVES